MILPLKVWHRRSLAAVLTNALDIHHCSYAQEKQDPTLDDSRGHPLRR